MLTFLLAIMLLMPAIAGETDKAWIGHRFQPNQCVTIRAGDEYVHAQTLPNRLPDEENRRGIWH